MITLCVQEFFPVADPEFHRRGAPTPQSWANPIIRQDFCRKLHENVRNWTN